MSRRENEVCFRCGCWFQDWNALIRHRKQAHELEVGGSALPQNTGAREKTRPVMPLMEIETARPSSGVISTALRVRPTTIGDLPGQFTRGLAPLAPIGAPRAPAPAPASQGNPSQQSVTASQEPLPSLNPLVTQQARMETLVEVACRWSRNFTTLQVKEMLEARFPDVGKWFSVMWWPSD